MRTIQSLFLVACALLFACSSTETRTQLNFEIDASPTLQSKFATLRVVVRSPSRGDQMQEFHPGDLTHGWPVVIVVIPAGGNHSTDEITVFATLYDASSNVVAAQSATASFEREKSRTVTLALDGTSSDGGALSADDAANGAQDAGARDSGHGGGTTDSAMPPAQDSGMSEPDSGGGVVNCASMGSTIKCDDGNPCNGLETCDPANASADNDGCVKGILVVTCGAGTTCDRTSGQCTTCGITPDGDKDGFNSINCGGNDCNDNDDTIAPGKPEICDGKDNDCDGVVDGPKADAICGMMAPTNGTDTCVNSRCTPACNDPSYQITNNMCVAPPSTCPAVNPCSPGSCVGGVGGAYSCDCPAGYRSGLGMTRCAKQGIKAIDIGFETTCDGMPTPGTYPTGSETKPISPTLYAACGVASITSGSMMVAPVLIQPMMATTTEGIMSIEGITKATALASAASTTGPSVVIISFSTGVTSLSFDVLGVSNPAVVSVVASTAAADLPAMAPTVAASGMHLHYAQTFTIPVTHVTITDSAAAPASNQFFLDELTFSVAGCGDGVTDKTAGEACDDGNAVQCDGCDNACATNQPGVSCTP